MPEYKTTFNYLLTHIEIPRMFFRILDQFYGYMITSPQGMQIFMQNITKCARDRAQQYPHVQPPFPVDNFVMYKYMRTEENDIVIVDIPYCERETDCSQIAFPCRREHARYFTCELSSDIMTGEKFYITGEWTSEGEEMTHRNYGRIDTQKGETFADTVRKIVYGEDAGKDAADRTNDLWAQYTIGNAPPEKEKPDEEDLEGNYYTQLAELAGMGWECYQHNELYLALQYFDRILEQEDDNASYFQCRSVIHKALGDVYKADYDLFRAKLIDMKDRAGGHDTLINTKAEEELGLEKRAPLIETEEKYSILRLENGKLLFNISAREGGQRLPELFYSGGKNALLRRRIDQYVLLTSNFEEKWPLAANDNYEGIYKTLNETDEIFVTEFIPYSETKENAEAYQVPVRHLPQVFSFDTPEEIRADGYPIFASIAALVRARTAEGLPISEMLPKDDIPTLAAVLAMEEDYPLLDKYIAENLPLNAKANWLFKDWQPTPLFYVTTYKVVQSMKDPVKMIRYLADNGADPNLESEEGDTPLGNQCYAKGTPEIMKALLDARADPNKQSHIEAGIYLSPLFMILLPDEYNEETHIFKPLTQDQVERAKLLIAAGANVSEKRESEETPLGLALTFAEGEQRRELFTLLRDKGANIDEALKGMEKLANQGNVEYSRALNYNIWKE